MHDRRDIAKRLINSATSLGAGLFSVLALLFMIDAGIPGASAAAPLATSAPKCDGPHLVVWLNSQGNGTAGSIYYSLELTNLSTHACSLVGYPGVSAINLFGQQLGSAASRDGVAKPTVVSLAPGAMATATLQVVEAGNYPSARCKLTTAAGLRVYPPNDRTAKLVPYPFQACSRAGPIYLSVGPVHKS